MNNMSNTTSAPTPAPVQKVPTVKICNLTDMETPALKQSGLSNRGLQVGTVLIQPGGTTEFDLPTWAQLRPRYKRLLSLGALCESTKLPPAYVAKMAKAAPAPSAVVTNQAPAPAPAPVVAAPAAPVVAPPPAKAPSVPPAK